MTSTDHHRRIGRRGRRMIAACLQAAPPSLSRYAGRHRGRAQPTAGSPLRARRRRRRGGSGRSRTRPPRRSHHAPVERPGQCSDRGPRRVADRYRIGGLTKSFTATIVLQLVREQKLALGDTVEHWLPGRHLERRRHQHPPVAESHERDRRLRARPGLPHPLSRRRPDTCLRSSRGRPDRGQPGTALRARDCRLSYSNTNYVLLAMIVEAATGNTIASELGARLFEPLGLRDTSFPMSPEIHGSHVHGYVFLDDGPFDVTSWSPSGSGAAAAIVSNTDDVARFYWALLRGRLIPRGLPRRCRPSTPSPRAECPTPASSVAAGVSGSSASASPAVTPGATTPRSPDT